MSETTLDRVPVAQAQASSGLSRSSFYKRLQHAGVVPLKVGVSSFLTKTELERLADCERWVQAGQKPEDFLASIGATVSPSAGAAGGRLAPSQAQALAAAQQLPLLDEQDAETPEDLVAAEVEHLDRLLSFLTKAARLSWCLPTSKVELLVGAKPRGACLERYGFRFRAGVGLAGGAGLMRIRLSWLAVPILGVACFCPAQSQGLVSGPLAQLEAASDCEDMYDNSALLPPPCPSLLTPTVEAFCARRYKNSAPRPGASDVEWRLVLARNKVDYAACVEQEKKDRAYQDKLRKESWRQYGNVRISWASWKKRVGSEVRTARGVSRCWFDISDAGSEVILRTGSARIEFDWGECPAGWEEDEHEVAVDCARMMTRVASWKPVWS